MTTKDYCIPFSKGENGFTISSNDHYNNLNLNQNHQPAFFEHPKVGTTTHSTKFSNNDAFTDKHLSQQQKSFNPRGKSIQTSNVSNSFQLFNKNRKETNDFSSVNYSSNNSTLSLHITAYENSVEANTVDSADNGVKKKSNSIKNWKNVKSVRNDSTLVLQKVFGFPRQQEYVKNTNPEVMPFKVSQKLLNPSEAGKPEIDLYCPESLTGLFSQEIDVTSSLKAEPEEYVSTPEIKSEFSELSPDTVTRSTSNPFLPLLQPSITAAASTTTTIAPPTAHAYVENITPLVFQNLLHSCPTAAPAPSSSSSSTVSRKYLNAPGNFDLPSRNSGSSIKSVKKETIFVCSFCNFSTPSKFHYNSHMNTHGIRQCTMCNYTTRTQGRLFYHMNYDHTEKEKADAGFYDLKSNEAAARSRAPKKSKKVQPKIKVLTTKRRPFSASNVTTTTTASLSSLSNESPWISSSTAGSSIPSASTVPSTSGNRKKKQYQCKHCSHTSFTKEQSWKHIKMHISSDKQLSCPYCPFITEFKQHQEYHIRNHNGLKPFRCSKCNYSCVNNSMLTSHMKAHSSEYKFACADCAYKCKYLHALQSHLQSYNHQRKESQDGGDMC